MQKVCSLLPVGATVRRLPTLLHRSKRSYTLGVGVGKASVYDTLRERREASRREGFTLRYLLTQ
ncbi:hypothetical protein FNW02_17760 [Komarekiella sp. 'clone 1']|uniref:Uncharacterized protein n=1 Tax=Komarekiella delphini-convector SJRDD-AB1 TaxID=2593771 RepID=A0AA40VRY2_9NOST|nr:hypothetical protein [Komarekiella delphini-convector]MBD6617624.1 hypothetical protein [Komarekiella delphini-convector SJRDD-AB1]